MGKKQPKLKQKPTEVYKPRLGTEDFASVPSKYEQTIYKNTNLYNNVQVVDKIYDGQIGETTKAHDPTELGVVGLSTPHSHLGRNKSGCLWRKGDGVKASSREALRKKMKWEEKVEKRKKA